MNTNSVWAWIYSQIWDRTLKVETKSMLNKFCEYLPTWVWFCAAMISVMFLLVNGRVNRSSVIYRTKFGAKATSTLPQRPPYIEYPVYLENKAPSNLLSCGLSLVAPLTTSYRLWHSMWAFLSLLNRISLYIFLFSTNCTLTTTVFGLRLFCVGT